MGIRSGPEVPISRRFPGFLPLGKVPGNLDKITGLPYNPYAF